MASIEKKMYLLRFGMEEFFEITSIHDVLAITENPFGIDVTFDPRGYIAPRYTSPNADADYCFDRS